MRSAAILLIVLAVGWLALSGFVMVALSGFITDPAAQQEQAATYVLVALAALFTAVASYWARPARWVIVAASIAWLSGVVAAPYVFGRDEFGRLDVRGPLGILLDGGLPAILAPGMLAAVLAALLLEVDARRGTLIRR